MSTQETIGTVLDRMVDEYITNLRENGSIRKPNMKSLIKVYKPAKKDLKDLLEDYHIFLRDVTDAIEENDNDLVEAWDFLNKTKLGHLRDFVENVSCFLEENSKITRRKRKVDPKKLVKALRLNEKKSVDPVDIIGSKCCILYQPKNNKIVYLESEEGMTVSGTTIKNFNDNSFMKSIRGNKSILKIVTQGTNLSAKNALLSINTKETSAVGRTNEETIILRASK